jgi:predicted peptidase
MKWKGSAALAARFARWVLGTGLAAAGCTNPWRHADPQRVALELAIKTISKTLAADEVGTHLPYRIYVPPSYRKERQYPLILYLHPGGLNGSDNLRQLTEDVQILISQDVQGIEPTFVLVPQCPEGDQWANGAMGNPPFHNYDHNAVPESASSKLTFRVLDEVLHDFRIDRSRLYVTGPSMGGSGTWDFLSRHPGVFAAGIPINGINDPSVASAYRDTPLWAFHGDVDTISPVSNTRSMIAAIQKVGGSPRYTEFAGVGHGCSALVYRNREMMRWLLSNRLAAGGDR